jgi:glycolate oxidase FAD binding subunit
MITRAVFRLHPLPRGTRSFFIATENAEEAQGIVLAIQDSKLVHTSLQSHFSDDARPVTNILFEGTEAGLTAQETQLRKLCATARVSDASPSIWTAREMLWASIESASTAMAKISILPANLARTMKLVEHIASEKQLQWKALMYATGLGWLRLEGEAGSLRDGLRALRGELESHGGSVVVLHRPENMPALDAWGNTSDALPLMKAVKQQLDPRNTLNPGRFVGGI